MLFSKGAPLWIPLGKANEIEHLVRRYGSLVPEALAEVQRNWLVKLRSEKGLAQAVNLAGPFIMSSQGKP